MTRGKQSLAQLQVQGEQEQGERGGPNVDALGSVISAGAWVHTMKGFSIVSEAEVDVFLEPSMYVSLNDTLFCISCP